MSISIPIIVAILLLLIVSSIRILKEYERGVMFTLGRFTGFGGIPRLKRDLGNAVVRDLLLTGRSFNVMKAQQIGLVSQIAAEGEALRVARATASQVGKFDRRTAATAKEFVKPIPYEELKREIDIFCDLYSRPAVEEGLRKFVENEGVQPYLP